MENQAFVVIRDYYGNYDSILAVEDLRLKWKGNYSGSYLVESIYAFNR